MFAFYQAVGLLPPISRHYIDDELAEQLYLNTESIDDVDHVGVCPKESGQMRMLTEEGQDVNLLGQMRLGCQQTLEVVEVGRTLRGIELP